MSLLLLYQNNNISPSLLHGLDSGGVTTKVRHPHVTDDREKKIRQEKILIEDSELVAIVELTFRNFII